MKKEERIDQIMNSLAGIQRAEANPFLYQKIKNRLSQTEASAFSTNLGLRLTLALAIVIVLNLFTIQQFKKEQIRSNTSVTINSEYSINLPETY